MSLSDVIARGLRRGRGRLSERRKRIDMQSGAARCLPAIVVLPVALLLLGSIAGCGFELRSDPVVPAEMARTYIATDDRYSLFYRRFRDQLARAGAEIVDSPVDATAELSILTDDTGQRVLSVSARNIPTEFEVYYTIYYAVRSGETMLLEPQLETLTRDYTYDVARVLGKAKEEELLREAIVNDLVRLVLIQISAIQ